MVDAKMTRGLYVVTGAYSCGKTTTMKYLAATHGYGIHSEAHQSVLDELGERTRGHPPGQPFQPVNEPDHFCPMCRPLEFAELVLMKQSAIEAGAADGDLLERGYLDPIEYYLRNTGATAYPWGPNPPRFAHYRLVFIFAVLPEVQMPRWGKTREQRIAEAKRINERLLGLYRDAGFRCHIIEPGTVEERADAIMSLMK
jgi:predicted ATPase